MLEVTYRVNCPRDFGKVRSMTIYLSKLEDGSYLPSPCIGCDYMNGLPICTQCVKSLFEKSLKDPTMKLYPQPINP